MQKEIPEISAQTLKQKLDENESILLLDVREPSEYDIVHLEDARLIPLNTLPHHIDSLPSDQEIIVYCHHGQRSLYAVAYLQQNGFTAAKNLIGGIDQWAAEIDPTLQRY
ncbi:hypothetical protein C6503_09315 [Candidatus Poribacteria bacterium]|nr:MAG: hypothetical protein C6503_09315 [Candidatus Poribacteria bacterium]